MNPSLAFDTSALVSLGHTELIELILDNYNVIISDRILAELTEIGEKNDKDARAANKWLEYSNKMELNDAMKSDVGEEELFEIFSGISPPWGCDSANIVTSANFDILSSFPLMTICQCEKLSMVTDDVKATKKFEDEIDWIFSVHVVFLLHYKGIISKERAIFSIEKMRRERSWKDNIISVAAKTLFQ